MADEEFITLSSQEGTNFRVLKKIALISITIKNLVEDIGEADTIPLPNVSENTLKKVIEYCTWHYENPSPVNEDGTPGEHKEAEEFDQEFIKMENAPLFELILAANYMDIKALLDLSCKTVANMLKGKTVEEIRTIFGIVNDFTPDEEEAVRKENEWCETSE